MSTENTSYPMLKIIKEAMKQNPSLKYIWGIIAISATTSLIFTILGNSKASIIGIALTTIGAAIISIVSKGLNKEKTGYISIFLLWGFAIFITIFLGFTISAFALSKPCNWVLFLDIPTKDCKNPGEIKICELDEYYNSNLELNDGFQIKVGKTKEIFNGLVSLTNEYVDYESCSIKIHSSKYKVDNLIKLDSYGGFKDIYLGNSCVYQIISSQYNDNNNSCNIKIKKLQ